MTILLYDKIELQERASKNLKTWKACHLVLYTLAAVFGLFNFIVMQFTMQMVDEKCVLFPKELEFRMIERPAPLYDLEDFEAQNVTENAQDATVPGNEMTTEQNETNLTAKVKREVVVTDSAGTKIELNMTAISGNTTHQLVLDTSRTLFETGSSCQFAEFMPIMSTIVAAMWLTMFTMCPAGGHARTGLSRPWRILTPAFLFSLVMLGLTGHSFTSTNQGLQAFCEAFSEVTNSTTCSSVNPYLERGINASWSFGSRVSSTRAASAGVWATWACVAALLLARCLVAPDFTVKRTAVYLAKDPEQKITPHLIKTPRSTRSSRSSPTKRDTASMRSEPTATTELVSAAVEPAPDTAPSSLIATPVKTRNHNSDVIEMTYNPHEGILQKI